MKEEEANLKLVLNFIEARKAGRTVDISHVNLGYSIRSLDNASWRTATATGALSLMEYNDVQRYAGAYQVQERVDEYLRLQSLTTYIDPLKRLLHSWRRLSRWLRRLLRTSPPWRRSARI